MPRDRALSPDARLGRRRARHAENGPQPHGEVTLGVAAVAVARVIARFAARVRTQLYPGIRL